MQNYFILEKFGLFKNKKEQKSMPDTEWMNGSVKDKHDVRKMCQHGICVIDGETPCAVCHSQSYLIYRIKTCISNSQKRVYGTSFKMNFRDEHQFFNILEVTSWQEACSHLMSKIINWNKIHKKNASIQMNILNMQIDHIRPVHSFLQDRFHKRTIKPPINLCNHYTNLQPMLPCDNNWKGSVWSVNDESFWLNHIILCSKYTQIYYPIAKLQPSLLMLRQTKKRIPKRKIKSNMCKTPIAFIAVSPPKKEKMTR